MDEHERELAIKNASIAQLQDMVRSYQSKLDRYRSALERIIEAWDGDSESMHNDPAVIAREALSDE